MAFVHVDRTWDITQTTGTGTYTCDNNPPAGYQGMTAGLATGNELYYCVTDGTDWEVGKGTFDETGDTVTRDTILASSNAGSAVNWGAGDKDITLVIPASRFSLLENFQVESQASIGPTEATGSDSIAIGDNAKAYETLCTAIGESAQAGISTGGAAEPSATAIGHDAIAYEGYCLSIGDTAVSGQTPAAGANYAIAIGVNTVADAVDAIAIGHLTECHGPNGIAIGDTADCKESLGIAIGNTAVCGQNDGASVESNCIAIGDAGAYETGCIAIGDGSISGDQTTSNSPHSVAIGSNAKAGNNNNATPSDGYAVAIGYSSVAYELYCIAIGNTAVAGSSTAAGYTEAVAIGDGANVQAQRAIGLGVNTTTYGQYGIAIGYDADARELHSICIGDGQAGQTNAGANGNYAVAIGYLARASEASCIALGRSALVGGTSGTAYPYGIGIGDGAAVTGTQSIAIGYQATASVIHYGVSIGAECDVEGDYSIAMGNLTEVRERYSIGIGYSIRTGQVTDGTGHTNIVAIGYDHNAYEGSAICIGASNTIGAASGTNAQYNTAIGHNISMVGYEGAWALGRGVTIKRDHEWVKGIDPAVSDARRGDMGMSITTTDDTPTKLKLNQDGLDHITLGTNDCFAFTALVVGCSGTVGKKAGYYIEGVAYRDTGNVAWVASAPTVTVMGEGDALMDCTMGLDTTNQGIYIEVTGVGSTTIQWAADVRFVEVDT